MLFLQKIISKKYYGENILVANRLQISRQYRSIFRSLCLFSCNQEKSRQESPLKTIKGSKMKDANMYTGAQLLVNALETNDTEVVFGVPGESYLAVLDAFYEKTDIDFIVCRQEGGAAMMADAYGKLKGRPGICFVTRGPGATNASAGVHIAFQDSSPMILFIGQVSRSMLDREAFQEIDYKKMFADMSKWTAQINDPARVPEYVSRAFHIAMSGRPGPVVLALPEDMLTEIAPPTCISIAQKIEAHPGKNALKKFNQLLSTAKKPLVILGGSDWNMDACENFQRFAEKNNLPVACAFRCQHLFDNKHPLYVGDVGIGINPSLANRVRGSDLLIAIGPRLGEITTSGYSLIKVPTPTQRLIHVHSGAEELGRNYQALLAINSSPPAFSQCLSSINEQSGNWEILTKKARKEYLEWSKPKQTREKVDLGTIVAWLSENTPKNTIITNGAGNYSSWVHRYYKYRSLGTGLAPTSGSMGYGTPAGICAKYLYPNRVVISFAGDGCYLMTGQELATAVQYNIPIIIIIINNGTYGTIRMHQEREYPERVFATNLKNPDFSSLARAYGAFGEKVERTQDFPKIFKRAIKCNQPAIIEVITSPETITPSTTISKIRKNALNLI